MMKKTVVANWKLNPDSPREARELFLPVKRAARGLKKTTVVVCPPVLFLPLLASYLNDSQKRLCLGAQDAFWAREGAWTGQIGPSSVRKSGGQYVILGHSEKRALGDSDAIIREKLKLALAEGLRVVLCVGEKERDAAAEYLKIIRGQLTAALERVPKRFAAQLLVAYEPLWAISTAPRSSGADTPADFLEKAIFIRKVLSHWSDHGRAMAMPVLYGGSVNRKNAAGFLAEGQADGLLVGRASLRPNEFREILKIADASA